MPDITQRLSFNTAGAQRSLGGLTSKLTEANTALKAFNSSATKGNINTKPLDKAKKKTEEFTISWKTMVRVIQTQVAIRAFNGFTTAISEAVTEARELGLAIAEVKTISGQLNVGNLTNDVLALSSALGQEAPKVAEGVYQTLSNQVVDSAHAMEFYEKAARLANITTADSADTVNAISSVMNSYNLQFEDTDEVMDKLFKTVEIGRVRMGGLANSIGKVTPLASQMGVTFDEVFASIAVMTRQGVDVGTATTQLRAILNKLLRPSTEMLALYNKWNVETAPQAIAKFGGLKGVIQEITKETGNDAAAIGELFKRIRSVAGYMSTATQEGEAFAVAMDQIGTSANDAKEAIDEFENTDAFRNKQATQEMKNAWTEIGKELLPAASAAALGIRGSIELLQIALEKVTFGYFNFNIELNKIYPGLEQLLGGTNKVTAAQRVAEETAKRVAKAYGNDLVKGFGEAEKAYSAYFSDVRSKERELQQIFTQGVTLANKRLEAAGTGLVAHYSKSVSRLKTFLNNARDAAKESAKEIAGIQTAIQDRQLEQKLSNARNSYQKLQILESEASKAEAKAKKEYRSLDETKDSKAAALAAYDRAIALNEQAKAQAKQNNNYRQTKQIEQDIQGLLKDKIKVVERYNKLIDKSTDKAQKELNARTQDVAELKQLNKDEAALLKERAKTKDPAAIAGIDKKLAALLSKIRTKLQSDTQEAVTGGFDRSFAKVAMGFQQAFDQAHFDWATAVIELENQLAQKTFKLNAEVSLTSDAAKNAEKVAGPQLPNEGGVAYVERAQKKAHAILKTNIEATRKLRSEEILRQSAVDRLNTAGAEGDAILQKQGERLVTNLKAQQQLVTTATTLLSLGLVRNTAAELDAELEAKVAATMGSEIALMQNIAALRQKANENKPITNEDLTLLQQYASQARAGNQLSREQKENLHSQVIELISIRDKQKSINNLKKEVPTEDVNAAQALTDSINKKVEGERNAAQQTRQSKINVQNTVVPASQTGESMRKAGDGAAATAAGAASASASLPGAAASAGVLASNLERAAAAAAAIGAAGSGTGAVAYHGGPMGRYFADGGMAPRGQDKIMTALSRGETVVNSRNSQRFFSELNAMNQGSQPAYREQGGPVTNVGDVNVTVNGGDSSQQTVRSIGHALRREIKRGTITLR